MESSKSVVALFFIGHAQIYILNQLWKEIIEIMSPWIYEQFKKTGLHDIM